MNRVAESRETVERTVERALAEDCAWDDATTQSVVPDDAVAEGRIEAREEGVLAGVAYADAAFRACDPGVELEWLRREGDRVARGERVLRCRGLARGLLAAERTALNFLQRLSGVATVTAQAAEQAGDSKVLDTRKTTPGLRDAEKGAVVAGGGINHRRDLSDELLLKENHFALSGLGYRDTVARARAAASGRRLGVEAATLEQARIALTEDADYVLLDNFDPKGLAQAVSELRAEFPAAVLEASGGIRPDNLSHYAGLGLDRISLGSLTHSAPSVDLSFYLETVAPREDAS